MRASRKTPEESLRIAVDALGGLQVVGYALRPDLAPDVAGQWLSHCLTATKRDKLSLSQQHFIFRNAHNAGEHDGFKALATSLGYNAEPIAPAIELAILRRQAEDAVTAAQTIARDLSLLIENPELMARMQKAGLKVGELL